MRGVDQSTRYNFRQNNKAFFVQLKVVTFWSLQSCQSLSEELCNFLKIYDKEIKRGVCSSVRECCWLQSRWARSRSRERRRARGESEAGDNEARAEDSHSTDYAADNSSEYSSSATQSPRHRHLAVSQGTTYENDQLDSSIGICAADLCEALLCSGDNSGVIHARDLHLVYN